MDLEKSVVSILPTTVTPFYPPTLISLKFKGLRKWESQESLEMFLDSLLSAAPKLTYLRELELYCIMDCTSDYKQRAEIREKYEDRLLHAFVRPHTKQPSSVSQRGSRLRDVPGTKELDDSYKGFAEPDRVEVKFDNMRPGAHQYTNADFLDEGSTGIRRARNRRGTSAPRGNTIASRGARGRGRVCP
ncbi:Similar to conserved hypothetical protein [Aspergillus clavatus NRRL 1]; acc. no. XP_001269905 [Pyronema omphalodes CBS 100304]|uniref:Uncharacterized protein n=1 Tax=Pyronema omphalodes (strain CBS 100304) TaxID=1076935 RepID=U4LT19_PYROM|nr:Similar to conserved hypothetical protein [Aspergillus clavatus NRRL 1]; acc. no. XP_001269905 [Pyronema omphalodes CBS 100304]